MSVEPVDAEPRPVSGDEAKQAMREYLDRVLPTMPANDPLRLHLAYIRDIWRAHELRRRLELNEPVCAESTHMYARMLNEQELEAFRLIQAKPGITERRLREAMGTKPLRTREILYKLVGRSRVDFV